MNTKHLIIRADASPNMGTGHVMRCLALAQAANKAGFEIHMICRISVEWVIKRLNKEKIKLHILPDLSPKEENPDKLLAQLSLVNLSQQNPSNNSNISTWVVLDGYHFTADCQKAVLASGRKLLVVDDYNHLPEYHCDILLNQNIGAEQFTYLGKIGKKLLGLEHVLLRQEFLDAREKAKERILPKKPKNILITLGGGNFIEHLEPIAKTMTMPELKDCTISIIQGAMDKKLISDYFVGCPATIKILEYIEDMPTLFLNTDLCITAGGSTCWELCCLGVPFLTVEIAENQNKIVAGLYNTYGIPYYSQDSLLTMLSKNTTTTIQNISLVGGNKLTSIFKKMHLEQKWWDTPIKKLINRKSTPTQLIRLEPAELKNSDYILHLSNDCRMRKMSFTQHKITKEEHDKWFREMLATNKPFFIAHYENVPCGYVRFNSFTLDSIISIVIDSKFRNMGIGTEIIKCACFKVLSTTDIRKIKAHIKINNIASIKAFTNAHFIKVEKSIDSKTITLEDPAYDEFYFK